MAPRKFSSRLKFLFLLPRVTQIMFCIICLCSAAATVAAARRSPPGAVHLALFASASGLLVSTGMMAVDMSSLLPTKSLVPDRLKRIVKGLLDFITSAILSVFFLSIFAALVPYGTCVTPSSTSRTTRPTTRTTGFGSTQNSVGSSFNTPGSSTPSSSSSSSSRVSYSPVLTSSDWSNTDSDYTDLAINLSDLMAMQQDTSMSVSNNNVGHRRLLTDAMLSTAAAAASGRRQLQAVNYNLVCSSWNAVVAMGFLNFIAYAVSAVLAVLDMRSGAGLYTPAWLMRNSPESSDSAASHTAVGVPGGKSAESAPSTAVGAAGLGTAVAPNAVNDSSNDAQQRAVHEAGAGGAAAHEAVAVQHSQALRGHEVSSREPVQQEMPGAPTDTTTAAATCGHIATTEFPVDSVSSVAPGQ